MTELADLVEAYKREVALPGAFATDFPTITDAAIQAALGDAFAEAQLDGFFGKMELDTEDWVVSPDLSTAGAALVVTYAGIRVLRQRLLAQGAESRYKAGPVEYESRQNSYAQTELLKQLERRKNQIIEQAQRGVGTSVFMLDGYAHRGNAFYGGLFDYEIALPRWAD
jgi:hypothetical protein